MDIREFLTAVGEKYDRRAGTSAAPQRLLRNAAQELQHLVPGGIIIKASGGKGFATFTPWLGFFDPDETSSPENGIYVVYLFAEDLTAVVLSLNQGITKLTKEVGRKTARIKLRSDAQQIREAIPSSSIVGLQLQMSLGSTGFRQLAYEAGNIAAKRYDLKDLPSEDKLRGDLTGFVVDLYQLATSTKRRLLQEQPGSITSPSLEQHVPGTNADPLANFKPKNDADYLDRVVGRTLIKTRRHETLIAEYGDWLAESGFHLSTKEHPKDLVIRRKGVEWLVEGKVIRNGNASEAVRETIGQLFCYKRFLYDSRKLPKLVALFSESIGAAYVDLLTDCGIASVWKTPDGWVGSDRARADGLTVVGTTD